MSYLHCHTKGCGWSQDDFYHSGYNPLTKQWTNIKCYIKPRIIEFDCMFVKMDLPRLEKYTCIKVFTKNNKCFSWNFLIMEIIKDIKVALKMKWWTYKSWKKDYEKGVAVCPKCGLKNFDID